MEILWKKYELVATLRYRVTGWMDRRTDRHTDIQTDGQNIALLVGVRHIIIIYHLCLCTVSFSSFMCGKSRSVATSAPSSHAVHCRYETYSGTHTGGGVHGETAGRWATHNHTSNVTSIDAQLTLWQATSVWYSTTNVLRSVITPVHSAHIAKITASMCYNIHGEA